MKITQTSEKIVFFSHSFNHPTLTNFAGDGTMTVDTIDLSVKDRLDDSIRSLKETILAFEGIPITDENISFVHIQTFYVVGDNYIVEE